LRLYSTSKRITLLKFLEAGVDMPDETDALRRELEALRKENARLRRAANRRQIKKALKESEERYRLLVENSPDGIAVHTDGILRYANPALARLMGAAAPEDLIGRSVLDFVHPDYRDIAARRVRAMQSGETIVPLISEKLVRLDGSEVDVEIAGTACVFEGMPGVQTFVRDVTERRQAEETLRYRIELETLIAGISSRLVSLTPDELDREIARALQAIGEFAGVDRSYVFLYSADGAMLDNTHEWCAAGIKPERDNLHGLRVDRVPWWQAQIGRLETIHIPRVADLPAEASAEKAILLAQSIQSLVVVPMSCGGEAIGFLGFDSVRLEKTWPEEDIALLKTVGEILGSALARHRAEEALRAGEARYRSLVEVSPDAISLTDLVGRLLDCNRQAAALHGYESAEDLIDRSVLELVAPEDRERAVEGMRRAREAPFTRNIELTLLRKDGSRFPAELNAGLMRNAAGEPHAFVTIIRDLTDRKRLEEQLLQAQKMESIGRLAGGVAHDFNNLLTAILGFVELAEMNVPSGSVIAGYLENARQAADRAAELTAQLLAFARKQIILPKVVNLNSLLRETDVLLRRLIGEHIRLMLYPGRDPGRVKADPGQLQQILINLALNARDAMPYGGMLSIETRNVALDAEYALHHAEVTPGEYVMLAVSDTGEGMTEEVLRHVFEPFFTTKEPGKGTGMGLATVYGIVKQNGGHITVYSEPGKGTAVKVYLPRVEEPSDDAPPLKEPAPAQHGTETILLVEDEPLVRELTARGLRARGYTVLEAENGAAALRLARRRSGDIHLLITDVVMPQMGGKPAADRLRKARPGIQVLFISGYTENAIVRQGMLEKGVSYLQKPFSMAALIGAVREALDKTA
jgi:two-component system cell cycle sensor histidine kinase/response regulator CckA